MALEIISSLGKERFKLAIFADTTAYYKDGLNYYIDSSMSDIVSHGGYDLTPDIVSMPVNTQKTIMTFSSGHYITLITEGSDGRSNYSDGYIERYYVTVSVWDKNNNRVMSIIAGHCDVKMVKNGVTTLLPIYIFGAVDKETKKGYILHARASAHGSSNTVKTNIMYNGSTYYSSSLWYTLLADGNVFDPDPWSNAGYAGIGGGDGTFDFASDSIALPEIPNIDAVSTGFLQLYSGGISKIRELAGYLWTDDVLTNLVKITQDPLSVIMSLYMYPFIIPASTERTVKAGNIVTPVTMGVPDKQIFEVDCGEFPIPSFYGAYLDYEPFAKCEIYLPYCGTHALSLDDIVGSTLNVRYRVDLLTGSCAAYIIVDGSVRYAFTGMCAVNIPITSQSFINNYSAILGLVTSGINALSSPTMSAASDIASNVMQCKPTISRGGSAAGNIGFMGVQKPTLIFTIPRVAIPKGLSKYTGYPLYSSCLLSDLKGYTEIEEIISQDFGRATSAEIAEIEKLLKGGVIL